MRSTSKMKKLIIICISVISLMIISCEGTKTAEEYFTAAEVERNAKNIKASLECLDNLINHYPEHLLSPHFRFIPCIKSLIHDWVFLRKPYIW